MTALLSAFGAGLLFGAGLWLSGMANPQKVLGFLDITGNWDPSLLLVMAGAVAVTLAAFNSTLKRARRPSRRASSCPIARRSTARSSPARRSSEWAGVSAATVPGRRSRRSRA